MPRIRWVNHPNPKLQHLNGTIAHETREAIAPYLISGQCELCPAPNFQTRLREEEEIRQRSLSQDPHFVQGVQWSVAEHTLAAAGQGRAYIVRRSGQEVLYGESPDAFKDCPQSVRVQFLRLNKVENPEAIAEKQIQENYRLQAEQKAQREREAAGLYRVTGGQR